jgi:hypothetical protein
MIIPSTTVRVLRSVLSVDGFGDPVDTDTVLVANLPACITPKTERTFNPASGQVTVINTFLIELRPKVVVFTERDRVVDERTGTVYQVENVATSSAMLMQEVISLTCSVVR